MYDKYYSGTIAKINDNGTYNVDLDDQITTFLNPYNGGFAAFKNSTRCVSPPAVLIMRCIYS